MCATNNTFVQPKTDWKNEYLTQPTQQFQQHRNTQNQSYSSIYLKSQQQLTNQEIQGKEHEILRKNKKTHTFFLKIEVEMMSNNGDFCEEHGGFERGSIGEDNEQS